MTRRCRRAARDGPPRQRLQREVFAAFSGSPKLTLLTLAATRLWSSLRPVKSHWSLAALLVSLGSCGPKCDYSGCDAFDAPAAAAIHQGLSGAVAYQSDVVQDGCHHCGAGHADLWLWATPALIEEEAEVAAVTAAQPTQEIPAGLFYDRILEPGSYLLCVQGFEPEPCVSFVVVAGQVTTVNVKLLEGPPIVRVFDAGSSVFRDTTTFSAPQ